MKILLWIISSMAIVWEYICSYTVETNKTSIFSLFSSKNYCINPFSFLFFIDISNSFIVMLMLIYVQLDIRRWNKPPLRSKDVINSPHSANLDWIKISYRFFSSGVLRKNFNRETLLLSYIIYKLCYLKIFPHVISCSFKNTIFITIGI